MQSNFKRNLLISSTISLLVLVISSTASYISIKKLLESNFWVNHTQKVIYNLNQGEASITDAQTNMRGFLVTGNEDFVKQSKSAEAASNAYFETLDSLTINNKDQQKSLTELRLLRNQFFKYLNQQITLKRFEKQTVSFDLNRGRVLTDELKNYFKKVEQNEQHLLKQRNEEAESYGTYSLILIIVAFVLAFTLTFLFLIRILKDFTQRTQLQEELAIKEAETAERIKAISSIASHISNGNYDIRVDDNKADAL